MTHVENPEPTLADLTARIASQGHIAGLATGRAYPLVQGSDAKAEIIGANAAENTITLLFNSRTGYRGADPGEWAPLTRWQEVF